MPSIPNSIIALGGSAAALKVFMGMMGGMMMNLTLPQALQSMVGYTIAEHGDCTYCSAFNEFHCRALGVDEATLAKLAADLGSVNPERIRAIIEFSLKVAETPKAVGRADFDTLRDYGVSDAEILELVVLSAISVASDTIADALKTQVEPQTLDVLGR